MVADERAFTAAEAAAVPGGHPLATFSSILVVPYTELTISVQRGGPCWPSFEHQREVRFCRRGVPEDLEPVPIEPRETLAGTWAWGGPVIGHFGHQLADFSTRLGPTLAAAPDSRFLFGIQPTLLGRPLSFLPRFFFDILEWYGIARDRIRFVDVPLRVETLLVAPQAEQIGRAKHGVAPAPAHLDFMDALTAPRLARISCRIPAVYVSRAAQVGRFAGEAALERALRAAGVHVVRPESLPLAEQALTYAAADTLIFAEGSAQFGTQLLGRALGDVVVLQRRENSRIAEPLMTPRARSLRYVDICRGAVPAFDGGGRARLSKHLAVPDHDKLLAAFATCGIALADHLPRKAFERARDDDVIHHVAVEAAHPGRPTTLAADRVILHAIRESGTAHLEGRASAMLRATLPGEHEAAARRRGKAAAARVNRLAALLQATRYLELGARNGERFCAVRCAERTGVGIKAGAWPGAGSPGATLVDVRPERFVAQLDPLVSFDIVALARRATAHATYRLFVATLLHAHPRTVWLLDDIVPAAFASPAPARPESDVTDPGADQLSFVAMLHDFHQGLDYRTIRGGRTTQMLVWRSPRSRRAPRFATLASIASLGYADAYDLRDIFKFAAEEDVLRTCYAALRHPTEPTSQPMADHRSEAID